VDIPSVSIRGLSMIDQLCQIMQNKADFWNARMNVRLKITKDYGNLWIYSRMKNKAKQTQF